MQYAIMHKGKGYSFALSKTQKASWKQPELTSNTSYGTISDSCYAGANAYLAFNGVESDEVIVRPPNSGGILDWQLPEQIYITKISILGDALKTISIYRDDEMEAGSSIDLTAETNEELTGKKYMESLYPAGYGTNRLYIVFGAFINAGTVKNILIEGYTIKDYTINGYDTSNNFYCFSPYIAEKA